MWHSFTPGFRDYPVPGEVIEAYRGKRSRAEIAALLGISTHTLYCYERSFRSLDAVSRLRVLEALLKIPPELLGLSPNEPEAPGEVIKCYRRAKTWTQVHLADALGVSELIVRTMENKGKYLDSLTRRRALAFLLSIPPTLLGLDTMHFSAPVGSLALSIDSTRQIQARVWTGYYGSHGQDQIVGISELIAQIDSMIVRLNDHERSQWIEQQSLLYQALSNITREYDPDAAASAANRAVSLARETANNDLLAIALMRRAEMFASRGCASEGVRSSREALLLPVRSDIIASGRAFSAAYVFSSLALDRVDRLEVYRLLDQVTPFPDSTLDTGPYAYSVDENIVRIRSAQALINLPVPGPDRSVLLARASEFLSTDPVSSPRRLLIYRLAQSQIAQEKRDFEQAAFYALESMELSIALKSVRFLPQLKALYQHLQISFPSPATSRLGLMLYQAGY